MLIINGKEFNDVLWEYVHSSNDIDKFIIKIVNNQKLFQALNDYLTLIQKQNFIIISSNKNDIYTHFTVKNYDTIKEYNSQNSKIFYTIILKEKV